MNECKYLYYKNNQKWITLIGCCLILRQAIPKNLQPFIWERGEHRNQKITLEKKKNKIKSGKVKREIKTIWYKMFV